MEVLFVTRGCPREKYNMNGIFEWDQAKAVRDAGCHVTYFAIDLRSLRRKRKLGINHYVKDGIKVYEYNFPLGRVPQSLLYNVGLHGLQKLYKRVYRDGKPDVIHAHFTLPGAIAATLARKLRIPIVVTEHSSAIIQPNLSAKTIKLGRMAYDDPTVVVSVGEGLKSTISKTFGIASTVISNVVDLEVFANCEKLPHNSYVFVTAGNVIDRKNHSMLVSAFSVLHSMCPDTKLVIIGSGNLSAKLKEQIELSGLSDCIEMTGRLSRSEIALKFSQADCFVLSSKYETFGVVLIEAMAAGLPVVSTRSGGPESFVTSQVGTLVPNLDVGALSDGMKFIMENHDKFDSGCIRAYAIDNFSGPVIAQKIIGCYELAIEKMRN